MKTAWKQRENYYICEQTFYLSKAAPFHSKHANCMMHVWNGPGRAGLGRRTHAHAHAHQKKKNLLYASELFASWGRQQAVSLPKARHFVLLFKISDLIASLWRRVFRFKMHRDSLWSYLNTLCHKQKVCCYHTSGLWRGPQQHVAAWQASSLACSGRNSPCRPDPASGTRALGCRWGGREWLSVY